MPRRSLVGAARVASALAVLGLLAVLAYYLPSPGYRPSRLYLFVLVGVVGVIGAVGAVLDRPAITGGSGLGIFLLGFWQAVLGVFMVPVAGVLLLTAIIMVDAEEE